MFTKTTKSQAIEQFKYNWKVYTLRCKREGKKVTKLAKVFAWQDFTEFLEKTSNQDIDEQKVNSNLKEN